MKPILFNTQMVQAILEGRKTVTRRVVKPKYSNTHFMFRTSKYGTEFVEMQNQVEGETWGKNPDGSTWRKLVGYIIPKAPYKVGDILYVRETWNIQSMKRFDNKVKFIYKVCEKRDTYEVTVNDDKYNDLLKYACRRGWQPSLFMPKEAARIFLKVTDVRAERLQDINGQGHHDDILKEGVTLKWDNGADRFTYPWEEFMHLWNSTVKKQDIDKYGWEANPWVWVIEFERVEVENE